MTRNIIKFLLATACALLAFGLGLPQAIQADSAAAQLVLTREGKAASAIVLGPKPTLSAQFAAAELQYHVEKITGAKLPIVDENADVKGTRILVGESRRTADLGLRSANFAPQEYLIAFRPNALVLIGRDIPLVKTAKIRNRVTLDYSDLYSFPLHFEENGTIYAVYDFLERFCGVRWYTATELGLCSPNIPTLNVSGKDVRRSPHMKYRWVAQHSFASDLCGDTVKATKPRQPLELREMRLFELRQRLGGEPYACNHSFYGYYDRFLKNHPDWFARGYEGQPPQMCYTDPEFIKQVVQDARDFFNGKEQHKGAHAMGDYFALVPMDNDMWCKCPKCRPLILEKPKRGADSQLNTDQASNYWFQFVNKVAREVRKTHPDRRIATIAYMGYAYPPENEPVEPNVSVQMTSPPVSHTVRYGRGMMRSSYLRGSRNARNGRNLPGSGIVSLPSSPFSRICAAVCRDSSPISFRPGSKSMQRAG